MRAVIRAVEVHLPDRVVGNAELSRVHPDWDMQQVEARSGVVSRRHAAQGETSLDLAVRACQKLFSNYPDLPGLVDGLIFCTQTPDYIMPPNCCLLQDQLGLSEDMFALDFNLACSGYVYGLALCQGLLASGQASHILLVTAETYSKLTHEGDRSTRVLFGDGAAVTWVAGERNGAGVIDLMCQTSGRNHKKFIIPAGGTRLPRSHTTALSQPDGRGNEVSQDTIHMDGLGVLAFVNSRVPEQVRRILSKNSLNVENVDCFIFHQASKLALDSLEAILKIPPERCFRNIDQVGNTVSASIPIALKSALDSRVIKPGHTVLLSGFGVGLSWATALVKF